MRNAMKSKIAKRKKVYLVDWTKSKYPETKAMRSRMAMTGNEGLECANISYAITFIFITFSYLRIYLKMEPEQTPTLSDIQKQQSNDQNSYFPKQHAKSKKKFKINTSRARGQMKLLKTIIKAHDWTEVYKEGDLMWSGFQDEDVSLGSEMKLNRIPAMNHICNKKTMGEILNKFKEYWPEMFGFFPKTYILPEHAERLEKKINTSHGTFIAKRCHGDGVMLIKKLSDIPKIGYEEAIVQPYLSNPILMDKKKFDFRLYVLITSVQPYLCYLNEEGLIRLCTEDYQKPNKQNLKNQYVHLTNYLLNKNHPEFVKGEEAFSRGGKRCLRVAWQDLTEQGVDVKVLKERIIELTQKLLTGIYPFLKYYYHATFPKHEGMNFHILGIDVLVDENMNPWLLQANSNPSLSIDHEVSGPQTKKELSPVDEYVKRMVIEDAIFLVNRKIESQKEMQIGENYYSYKKILDSDSEQLKGMNLIENMLKVFHSQCSLRSKWVLSSSQFIKLSKLEGMTSETVTKNDYHLIFIKIMRDKSNPNQMQFDSFIEAMEYIVKEVVGYTKENKLGVMQEHLEYLVSQL